MSSAVGSSSSYYSSSSSSRRAGNYGGGGVVAQPSYSSRQTDWDRQLEDMLQDLESPNSNTKMSSNFSKGQQQQQSSYSKSSSSSFPKQQNLINNNNADSFVSNGLAKQDVYSNNLGKSTDKMMKDLEGSLNASTNYIKTHRTETGPSGTSEYHEFRSYGDGGTGGGFDLSNQVQHMIPMDGMMKSSSQSTYSSSAGNNNLLQKKNMMSSYSAYSSSSKYTSSGGTAPAVAPVVPPKQVVYQPPSEPERPGSSLKQNIDDLDNLLDDLNKAQTQVSSDDYYSEGSNLAGNKKSSSYQQQQQQSYSYSAKQSGARAPSPAPPVRTVSKTTMKPFPDQQMSSMSKYESSYHSDSKTSKEPPKQVDQLLNELSSYDDSSHVDFSDRSKAVKTYVNPMKAAPEPEVPKPAPVLPSKEAGVDYPLADEIFPTAKQRADTHLNTVDRSKKPQKAKKDKLKGGDGEDKKGAAVVPICLPLCCAAPCVIM